MKLINDVTLALSKQNIYIKLYTFLLRGKRFKSEHMVLYSVLRNKLELSIKRNYKDHNGDYYIHYKIKELAKLFRVTEKTLSGYLKVLAMDQSKIAENDPIPQLIKLDRIESNTYRIYFNHYLDEDLSYEVAKREAGISGTEVPAKEEPVKKYKFSFVGRRKTSKSVEPLLSESVDIPVINPVEISGTTPIVEAPVVDAVEPAIVAPVKVTGEEVEVPVKITGGESVKITGRKKDLSFRNNKTFRKPNNKNQSINQYNNQVKTYDGLTDNQIALIADNLADQLELHELKQEQVANAGIIDDIYKCAVEMLVLPETKILKQEKKRDTISSVLVNLTKNHIVELVNKINTIDYHVTDPVAYLKTMIYNACKLGDTKMRIQTKIDSKNYAISQENQQNQAVQATSGLDSILNDPNFGMYPYNHVMGY